MTIDQGRTNILIVDDLPEKILVYRTILDELEQNLVVARSGEEALKQVLQLEFAVILLDVNMPGMNGFETAALIRKRKKSAHTPIIFITAFADDMRAIEGYAHGAVNYILAPVVPDVLRAKVNVFVNLFRMSEQVKRQAEERLTLAEERTERAAAEESSRRLEFLATTGSILGRSLDFEDTALDLARLAVPFLADQSIVAFPTSASTWRVIVSQLIDERQVRSDCFDDFNSIAEPIAAAIRRVHSRGTMELVVESDSTLNSPATATIQALAPRGETLAVLALVSLNSGRRFRTDELAMAAALATRAAVALDNARLYGDVQRADRQKNEFLSMLAHELRNPLAPIRSAVDILRLLGSNDPALQSTRDIIDRQVRHLVRLVDDLLDVSRITQGKIRLQMETVDISAVIASAIEISRPLIELRRHEFVLALPSQQILLRADAMRLAQILANLLNNAAKYTEQGGRIWLTVEQQEQQVWLRVRDTGIGISSEMLAKIFDLFTQADRSLDRSQGGLGIGLTLVRHLVEMHAGTVEARSDGLGKGSEFIVRLPLLNVQKSEPTSPDSADELAAYGPCRLLVVDDNVDAAESLAMLLRIRGNDVQLAHDGPRAIEMATDFRPNAVLLDIGLPGMNGYEVVRALRNQTMFADTLIVAISGYGQDEDREMAIESGFNCHLTKPVNIAELNRLLDTLDERNSLAPNTQA